MHELAAIKQVAKTVLAVREQENAGEIRSITLLVGEGRNFDPEWVQNYFDMLTEGTDVYGARIRLETVPATCKCSQCGEIYRWQVLTGEEPVCTECGSTEYELCTGYELILKSVEVTGEEGKNL